MLVKDDTYKLRFVADTYVLVSCRKSSVNKWLFHLNKSGALIWQCCQNIETVEELVNKVAEQYNDISDEQKNGIRIFIEYLIAIGLIMEVRLENVK